MSFDRGEWETRTAERNAADWPDRPRLAYLDQSQLDVIATRDAYDAALLRRRNVVATLHRDGVTIYAIAKRLGVTQSAVRKMLRL